MNQDFWEKQILEMIKEISDEKKQEEVWLKGQGAEVSSYEEVICSLYDDLNFELFLEKYDKEKNILYKNMLELNNKLNIFIKKNNQIEISDLLFDREWNEIQNLAKKVVEAS